MRSPLTGLTATAGSAMPLRTRSDDTRSTSVSRRTSSRKLANGRSSSVPETSSAQKGFSGARTKNVAPHSVSGRVVNTG